MSVYLRVKKNKKYFSFKLDIYHNGVRQYQTLDITAQTINRQSAEYKNAYARAEAIRARREAELSINSDVLMLGFKMNADFFTFFQARINSKSGRMITQHTAVLKHFKKFTGKDRLMFSQLNKTLLRDFRSYLDTVCSASTPSSYFKRLQEVIRDAVDMGYLKSDIGKGITNTNPVANTLRKNVLFADEIEKLSKTPCKNFEVRRAFLFACMTGFREVDCRSLHWDNVDLKGSKILIDQNKTGVPIWMPLNQTAVQLLGKAGSGRVFKLPNRTNVRKHIVAWANNANLNKRITFNCARHSFASNILIQTGNIKVTSKLLGHTTTRMTDKYLHVTNSSLVDAVGRLPSIASDAN